MKLIAATRMPNLSNDSISTYKSVFLLISAIAVCGERCNWSNGQSVCSPEGRFFSDPPAFPVHPASGLGALQIGIRSAISSREISSCLRSRPEAIMGGDVRQPEAR
jgi:hypothetical protein